MTHWTSFAGVSLVALSLAFPDPSWAQARSRGGSGGGSSSGGSSSGGQVSRPSGGGSSGGARSAPSQGVGGSRAVARPRSGAPSGGGGGGASSSSGSQSATVTRSAGGIGSSGNARARGNQPVVGAAQRRLGYYPGSPSRPGFGHYPDYPYYSHYPHYSHYYPYYPYYGYPYYPYSAWYGYPWYGGFGFSIGFGYSPWYAYPYGAFGVPYYYAPYSMYGYTGGSYSDNGSSDTGSYSADVRPDQGARNVRRPAPTGSVRLRANPRHARVYVDGALVGTVDEFDGLSDHLEIEAGRHQIEIRADGYESYSSEIAVQAGRTVTERANLKKIS